MRYCPTCKSIFTTEGNVCTGCNEKTEDIGIGEVSEEGLVPFEDGDEEEEFVDGDDDFLTGDDDGGNDGEEELEDESEEEEDEDDFVDDWETI